MNLQWNAQNFLLLGERALLWEDKATLIFSDVHLGKAQDMQAQGIPVPATIHDEDLARMELLLKEYRPERVFVLGDFVHSHRTPLETLAEDFRALKRRHIAKWTLTVGNHDRAARLKLQAWEFDEIRNEVVESGIHFSHGHSAAHAPAINGHMHPVFRLGSGRDRMRLPCFWVREKEIVLPSFGEFTGGFEIQPTPSESVYVVAQGHIYRADMRRA